MRTKKAFTIVELLAVVGIIIILMSLIIPAAGKAMEKANLAAAKAMLEKLEMAVRNYQTAYGQWPPDLSYKYLGKKLPSYNFGAVLPLLNYEKENLSNPSAAQDDWVYKDPWDQVYRFYWIGQTPDPFKTDFGELVASGSSLNPTPTLPPLPPAPNHLSDVIDPPTVPVDANTKLVPGFLLWSLGPDTATVGPATADNLGNWGKLRSKMVSGVAVAP